jgi:hypothetical protein
VAGTAVTSPRPLASASYPLAGTIGEVLPALSEELVDRSALRRIDGVARRLPAALTDQVYFECRLGAGSRRVDVLVRVDRSALSRLVAGPGWGVKGDAGALGPRLATLAGLWIAERRLDEVVAALWLEFDLDEEGSPDRPGPPRLFVEIRRSWRPAPQQALAFHRYLSARLRLPRPDRAIARVLGRLAPPARLLAIGFDPARAGAPSRLCFWHPRSSALGQHLGHEEGAPVEAALAHLKAPATPLVVHLDAGGGGITAQGVELTFERACQLQGELRERAFLDNLVASGLCHPQKAAGLGTWPGYSVRWLHHQIWPSSIIRRINHIKLRIEAGRAVEAKAYLSFHHRFRETGRYLSPERAAFLSDPFGGMLRKGDEVHAR